MKPRTGKCRQHGASEAEMQLFNLHFLDCAPASGFSFPVVYQQHVAALSGVNQWADNFAAKGGRLTVAFDGGSGLWPRKCQ